MHIKDETPKMTIKITFSFYSIFLKEILFDIYFLATVNIRLLCILMQTNRPQEK